MFFVAVGVLLRAEMERLCLTVVEPLLIHRTLPRSLLAKHFFYLLDILSPVLHTVSADRPEGGGSYDGRGVPARLADLLLGCAQLDVELRREPGHVCIGQFDVAAPVEQLHLLEDDSPGEAHLILQRGRRAKFAWRDLSVSFHRGASGPSVCCWEHVQLAMLGSLQ